MAGNGTAGAWSPSSVDLGQWIQVDLGENTIITKISTQGRQDAFEWVTQYKVSHSLDGRDFNFYQQAPNSSLDKVRCEGQTKRTCVSVRFCEGKLFF